MQQFIEKYGSQIQGVVTGWDRLVLRGSLRRLNYGCWDKHLGALVAKGMEEYRWQNKLLFKDYAQHVKQASEHVKRESLEPFRRHNLPIVFLRSPSVDQDQLARRLAAEQGIESGLVCGSSAVEPSPTLEHRGTHIIRRERPCHVLYHYRSIRGWVGCIGASRPGFRLTSKWR